MADILIIHQIIHVYLALKPQPALEAYHLTQQPQQLQHILKHGTEVYMLQYIHGQIELQIVDLAVMADILIIHQIIHVYLTLKLQPALEVYHLTQQPQQLQHILKHGTEVHMLQHIHGQIELQIVDLVVIVDIYGIELVVLLTI
jgi:putative cell wall-binding protein